MRLQNFSHFQNGRQNTEKNGDVWETFGNSILLLSYLVTIELILAGDENLTPNQNIEIFSAVYSFIRSTQRFN